MDKQILEQQIEGLKASIESLRESERVFIKAQTLNEQIEKARADKGVAEASLEGLKDKKKELQEKKRAMLAGVCRGLEGAITALLPEGSAVMQIDSDSGRVFIGFKPEGARHATPYTSLSGGQRVFFEAALANAMMGKSENKVLVLEGAEMDEARLIQTMETLAKNCTAQVLLNTWFEPSTVPAGWKVIRMGGKDAGEVLAQEDVNA